MKEESILQRLNSLVEQKEKPLNVKEACKYLDISQSYLYKLTHKKQIPFFKPNGKKNYFLESELRKWLLRNRHSSEQELEQKTIDYIVNETKLV